MYKMVSGHPQYLFQVMGRGGDVRTHASVYLFIILGGKSYLTDTFSSNKKHGKNNRKTADALENEA